MFFYELTHLRSSPRTSREEASVMFLTCVSFAALRFHLVDEPQLAQVMRGYWSIVMHRLAGQFEHWNQRFVTIKINLKLWQNRNALEN